MKWSSKIFSGLDTGIGSYMKKFKLNKVKKSGNSTVGTSYAKSTYVFKECHKGDCLVFKVGNLSVYAGGWSRSAKCSGMDLLIDLANDRNPPIKVVGDVKGFEKVVSTAATNQLNMVVIRWPDFGIPIFGKETWLELAKSLAKKAEKQEYKVQICCQGGHGRTGTALSILAHIFGINGDIDPISWVRKNYCEETVENNAQIEYVESMCGIQVPVTVLGAKTSSLYSYSSGVK